MKYPAARGIPPSRHVVHNREKKQETFHGFDSETQRREVGTYSGNAVLDMLDYVYDHFEEFCLLLDASYGTSLSDNLTEQQMIAEWQ